MTDSDPAAGLARVRDLIAEARRYVRSDPEGTVGRVDEICEALFDLPALAGAAPRLTMNLLAGAELTLAWPDVLEGYLTGASAELLTALGRLTGGFHADGRA